MRRIVILASLLAAAAACGGESASQSGTTSGAGGAGGSSLVVTTGPVTIASTVASSVSSTTGSGGGASDVYPAFAPSVPYVVTSLGPLLADPQVYPIFFAGDDSTIDGQIQDFVNTLGATDYWKAIGSEYGIFAMTGHPAIVDPVAPPSTIDDSGIQAYLKTKLGATPDPSFPTPDANTVFAIYYPANVTITQAGTRSCHDFGGYHNDVLLDSGQKVAYAVIPRCQFFGGMTGIDALTSTSSHEFIEAATDPYPQRPPMGQPAYQDVDADHFYWSFAIGGGEVGDMCAQLAGAFTKFDPFPYFVQRSWSNTAARAFHDPCQPTHGTLPYFNAAPVLPDLIQVFNYMSHGVSIPIGQTKTVELDLFSDAPMPGPWQVQVIDESEFVGGAPALSFSMDKSEGLNGEKIQLSITSIGSGMFNTAVFYVFSSYNDPRPGSGNMWIGFVGQQ